MAAIRQYRTRASALAGQQHVDQESFYIVEGTLEVACLGSGGLEWFPVTAGDSIHVPSNEIQVERLETALHSN